MPRKSRKNVGLIGLGIIGSRVAAALRQAGFHVYVWNRTPRAAPNFLGSPGEVAELCDVIQIFVADSQALFQVLEEMKEKLTDQHVIVCNATIGPEATIEAAKVVTERGAQFLDAPFTGSKAAADARQLVYFIGGASEVFRRVEPMLKVSSKQIVQIGKIGQAATVKVATNMLAAVTVQTLAEAVAIVQRSGIAPSVLADALEHHGVRSAVLDQKLGQIVHRDYEPHFSLKHMFKDVQLGIHIANSLDLDIPATTATAGVMYGGLNRGWGDLDFAALAKIYEPEEKPQALLPAPAETPPPVEIIPPSTAEPAKETLSNMVAPPRPEEPAAPPTETPIVAEASVEKITAPVVENTETPTAEKTELPNTEPPKSEEPKPARPLNRIRRWFGASAS